MQTVDDEGGERLGTYMCDVELVVHVRVLADLL